MDVIQATLARRSIRRFTQAPVPATALEAMVEAARLSPTGTNLQPLQFVVITGTEKCEQVFPCTYWAGKIPDGSAGPDASTQPTAYIAILVDTNIAKAADTDAGAAAMSIQLVATSLGIASCWLGKLKRPHLMEIIGLSPERFTLHTIVALGYPAMQSRAVPQTEANNTDYYLESKDHLCVPKRSAADTIHWLA